MILPVGAVSPDARYPFPNMYGTGYGAYGRIVPRQTATPTMMAQVEVRDTVTLSLAAQRIMEQAERMKQMSMDKE